jgi:hypothetical protein
MRNDFMAFLSRSHKRLFVSIIFCLSVLPAINHDANASQFAGSRHDNLVLNSSVAYDDFIYLRSEIKPELNVTVEKDLVFIYSDLLNQAEYNADPDLYTWDSSVYYLYQTLPENLSSEDLIKFAMANMSETKVHYRFTVKSFLWLLLIPVVIELIILFIQFQDIFASLQVFKQFRSS